jgi:hypothetical protein
MAILPLNLKDFSIYSLSKRENFDKSFTVSIEKFKYNEVLITLFSKIKIYSAIPSL